MPVTPSHAAAAWILAALAPRLPLAAIVVGTLAPDFEYLLRLAPRGRTWHTPFGFVAFAIPAGLLVWAVWHALVRPSVRTLLPPALGAPLAPMPVTARLAAAALPGVVLGALSHVAWDGLTHRNDWGVVLWPALRTGVSIGGIVMPLYNLLQHLSTIAGAGVIVLWIVVWWRRQPPADRVFTPAQRRALLRAAALVAATAAAAAILNALRAPADLAYRLGYGVVGGMAGFALAAFMWGVVHRLR